jgi:NAD(P)-dependent dehydrogenase (short-subunit alcohol dehydrogenase family)
MNTPVVLITGALTGIGRATAFAFATGGARIVVSGRHEDAGQALVAELRKLGAEAEFVEADVRHEDEVRNLVDHTVKRFGGWTLPSTTPGPKARRARCPNRPLRLMRPHSTPTCSARS